VLAACHHDRCRRGAAAGAEEHAVDRLGLVARQTRVERGNREGDSDRRRMRNRKKAQHDPTDNSGEQRRCGSAPEVGLQSLEEPHDGERGQETEKQDNRISRI